MLVNVTPREIRVAILEHGVLQDIHLERSSQQGLVGNIYKARVNRLVPGIQAAFVDVGLERAGFLYVGDVHGYTEGKNIQDLLVQGQDLLVQVSKNPLGSKSVRLTTHFTLPSRYLVLTPNVPQITISQKIQTETERQRLMQIITPGVAGGYIVRTVAEGVCQEDIQADKHFLETCWIDIQERARYAKVGDKIYEEIPMVLRLLRDFAGHKIEKIRVDDVSTAQTMRNFTRRYLPQMTECIEEYHEIRPLFDIYSVEEELEKALQRKIYLKSGGYVIFDQTEAMVTIDVNTGSYLGTNDPAQTILKTNLEAVKAIAQQIRLRNLGGIIIIDFIDMTDNVHKQQILNALEAALANDPARVAISELSSLGLIQLTRKRARESLEQTLNVMCPLCQHRGSIKSIQTVSYEILRALQRAAFLHPWMGFLVVASKQVVEWLQQEEADVLAAVELQLGKPVQLQVELSLTQERYNILPL